MLAYTSVSVRSLFNTSPSKAVLVSHLSLPKPEKNLLKKPHHLICWDTTHPVMQRATREMNLKKKLRSSSPRGRLESNESQETTELEISAQKETGEHATETKGTKH